MNTNLENHNTSGLFSALRSKLAREVCGSAMLADLLQKVNGMEEAQTCPAEFKGKFDEFVGRAEEYSTAIQPFYPELVGFLPSRSTISVAE